MKSLKSPIHFKGERDYVQGADLYDAFLGEISSFGDLVSLNRVRLSIKKFIKRRPLFLVTTDSSSSGNLNANWVARFGLSFGSEELGVLFYESTENIQSRKEDFEGLVFENTKVDEVNFSAVTLQTVEASPMETVIAANKLLHIQTGVSAGKKCLFTGLDLAKPLFKSSTDYQEYSLKIDGQVGSRLTRSRLYVDQEFYGYVFFSMI